MTSSNGGMKFETTMPDKYRSAHKLCFLMHDIMLQALKSGEFSGVFMTSLKISCEDEESLKLANNIFDWLDVKERSKDKIKIIRATVLQAV
ncbi:hypothetical protein L9F41_006070, partial [Klebsiella variicola]|nr:hypothetical protein [Klebsiella variicola]